MMRRYRYPALMTVQGSGVKPLIVFSAPAAEIEAWAGVPQKKRFGVSQESVGFQREQNSKRIAALKKFFQDSENVVQNPLLCASRLSDPSQCKFIPASEPDGETNGFGFLEINVPDFATWSFQEILGKVRDYIEGRVPELAGRMPSKELIATLKDQARIDGHISGDIADLEVDHVDADGEVAAETNSSSDVGAVLFEESHIFDFWEDVAARHEIAKQIPDPIDQDEFIGFSRDALTSYLCPVVLVDGQHRLRGANAAARDRLLQPDLQAEIESRIGGGENAEDVENSLLLRESRKLSVSLLLTDDPAEQVFQFVVVNQKATPIGRALLGTIVSTTLSNDELGRVATRLKDAAIELEESQAITYLARHKSSPFCGLVERGLASDQKDLLQWNVFASIISVFKDLSGGRLFHQKTDFADAWRKRFLDDSPITDSYESFGCQTRFEYWSKLDGPWRDVFIVFFAKIRDEFGDTSNPDRWNYWGRPRESNLFNKISLTILAADFFEYLVTTRTRIKDASEVASLVDDWLDAVNRAYFDRDWNLSGIKKDNPGIRKQWAALWSEYRKNPAQLPDKRNFRTAVLD
ncbi:hypothetical protein FNF07_13180 [Trinickia caryophylli]|uniref:DGQHR domain-containing protein n=2 Tax=Trinickia caryophylli TaxID=28094 RepID=A0A1X7GPT7_TRICW|nr:hypothetical protein [Trinickia caryophylli]PMS10517.1 hypothetical protein C0Z17_19290 [Trinickia caryophylli]TRX19090.1 hypothetical protein FNF07_13180 [Trinickia caryophylli]SMF72950.1 hypothetical protein SAMN06295900_11755 [Trinickia caryophylli]